MLLKYKEVILYAVFLIIVFIFSITKLQPELFSFINVKKTMGDQSRKLDDLESRLSELKQREAEKMDLSEVTKDIFKPDAFNSSIEDSSTVIFDDVIDMAKYNGIKIYSIGYVYNPKDDEFVTQASDKYNVCQLNLSLISDYLDLGSFLKDLYKYPYLINIGRLDTIPYPKNKKILMTNLQIKLYTSK